MNFVAFLFTHWFRPLQNLIFVFLSPYPPNPRRRIENEEERKKAPDCASQSWHGSFSFTPVCVKSPLPFQVPCVLTNTYKPWGGEGGFSPSFSSHHYHQKQEQQQWKTSTQKAIAAASSFVHVIAMVCVCVSECVFSALCVCSRRRSCGSKFFMLPFSHSFSPQLRHSPSPPLWSGGVGGDWMVVVRYVGWTMDVVFLCSPELADSVVLSLGAFAVRVLGRQTQS